MLNYCSTNKPGKCKKELSWRGMASILLSVPPESALKSCTEGSYIAQGFMLHAAATDKDKWQSLA